MSVPRFFSRINDAVGPLLTTGTDLRAFLEGKVVCLSAPPGIETNPAHLAGFKLAVNLCARLYPHIRILAPGRVTEECVREVTAINPNAHVMTEPGPFDGELSWGAEAQSSSGVIVSPSAWDVLIDHSPSQVLARTNALTALAAGALGAGELFRTVFASFLTIGRTARNQGSFNLLTLGAPDSSLPPLPEETDIGHAYIVGVGAIGQATVRALAQAGARGTLIVVDPEHTTLSNLQRYILTTDSDVGVSKCSIVMRTVAGTALEVVGFELPWGHDGVNSKLADTVCAAVDTESLRIALQAGLPRRLYNAWTQPADLGWSRHEAFGIDPCLACLYWPSRPRPHLHQLVAAAIKQHELRVLAYLTLQLPIDVPIPVGQIPNLVNYSTPADAGTWAERPLLDDIVDVFALNEQEATAWNGKQLMDLYREGICGGALVRSAGSELEQGLLVPLAHQSALAGIMLATQLIVASCKDLQALRPREIEGRLDLMAGFPQIPVRPRERTANCLCADSDFLERHRAKWPS